MKTRIAPPLIFAFVALLKLGASAQTTTLTFNNPAQNGGTNSFTVPAGVTSITVQCWGGGGGGGNSNNGTGNGGGGGGGGAFAQKVFTSLTAGTVYTINVGAGGSGALASSTTLAIDGSDSWFSNATTVMAKGGTHGLNNSNSGGAGGLGIGTSIGDAGFIFSGGSAGNGSNNGGSAGGSSAGTAANGSNGANAATNGNITVATTAPSGGGNGGRGNSGSATNAGNGEAGSAPGGGGGGSDDVASKFGGSGANGQVVVTYTLPNVTGLSAAAANTCSGSSATVTVSSSNLSTGTYTITYNVSGTNSVSSTTATISFTSGSPGTGTFTTSSLVTAGAANVVNVTKFTDQSTNNSSSLSVGTAAFTTSSAPAIPESITGTTAQCASTSALTYSITAVANATTYTWAVPTGWSITAGQGTTSVTVTSGVSGQNGNVTVTASNSCGTSAASTLGVTSSFCSKTYYSLGGNWNSSGSWSTVSHASSTNTGTYPVAGDIALIGGSNTITVQAGTSMAAASVAVSDDASTSILAISSAASLTISGDLTVNTSGSLSSSTTGTVVFNGSSAQTISGSGSLNFGNVIMSTTGATNVAVSSNITVNGTISWTADGLLVVGSNSNVTLGTQATPISSPTSARYIQLDGASGSNSNLLRTTSNSITQWQFTFPVGTASGGYTPLTIPIISAGNLPTNNSTLSVKPIVTSDLTGRLKRTFRLTVVGNTNATTFSNGAFSYSDAMDVSSGDAETDYTTGWLLVSGGTWSSDAGTVNTTTNTFTIIGGTTATASLSTGTYYYTCGSTVNAQHTWYSYQTGNYSDFNTWTLDPSGTTFDNALNIYPTIGDEIHILNGFTVTVDISSQNLSATTINGGGTLDLSTTTGHTLGVITGTGLLREKGSTLPSGTYTDFVSTSGGTIEYYDAGGNLPTAQTTYNKLLMTNSTGSNITYVLVSDMTVNGTLNLTATGSGTVTWQINDASNTQRTITLNSDLTVGSGGAITTGNGNSTSTSQHSLTFYGNFTNNGIVQFFDPTDASFSSANYTSGAIYTTALKGNAINVTFSGVTNKVLTCNAQTDFYRLILNKGTGQQAMLTVNSASTSNFRLFGPNNQARTGSAPNYVSNNNLSISNGTLQLTGSINIPSLIVDIGASNSWPIPQNGAMWINSSNVTVQVGSNTASGDNKHLHVFGFLRVSNGTLNLGYSRGLLGGGSGYLLIEGGTINTWQLRTTNLGTGNNFAYVQTGGTVNVGTSGLSGVDITDYPRFSLTYTTCTFQMSGGVLNVGNPMNGGTGNLGGIQINTATSSTSVTGGTVNAYVPASGVNFTIASTAPFYNLNINQDGAGAAIAILNAISAFDGTSTIAETAQPLTVLNNLTLVTSSSTTLSCNATNLTVGGNLVIQSGTTLTPGLNAITFNGTAGQALTNNGTVTNLNSVVVNKSGTLTFAGNTLPSISSFTLTSGTFADGGSTVSVTGTLSNSAIHTSVGNGNINFSGTNAIAGSNGKFGNLTISSDNIVATSGDQTVSGNLRLISANSTLNIASYALTVSGNIYSDASSGVAFSTTKRILASGLHNAGGLTLQGISGDLLFPIGSSAVGSNAAVAYTPITINVSATTQGTITVRPVNSEHPNVTATNKSLVYYWRITSSGFLGVSAVMHKNYTFSTATKNGISGANYRSARYDRTNNKWGTINTPYNATGTTAIPDFNTGTGWTLVSISGDQLDGEYTCGDISAFGSVVAYYSRASGNWNDATNVWSTVSNSGAACSCSPVACATCPVIIGDGASNNHTITIDANSRTCGTLSLSSGSTLDCGTFTSLNFGSTNGGAVTGAGILRIASANFPAGDFTNFLGSSGGTTEWYGTSYTIPSAGPTPQNLSLASYYNLVVNPNAGSTITLPASNLTIYNNFTQGSVAGFTGTVVTNGSRTISVNGNLTISLGTFSFSNANPSITTMTVNGNTTVANGATMSAASGGTANVNTFSTPGNFTNNGTVNFNNNAQVNLTFTGSSNTNFSGTGSGGTILSLLTVNKGTSQTPTLTFNVGGTVTANTSGWLTLLNGTFDYQNSSTVAIVTSVNTFTIPSTAKLRVTSGTVNILNNVSNSADLLLNGALEVAGGTVNIAGGTSGNDIEYAAAGTPTISVTSGSLNVNGSIRRSTSSLSGALIYNQASGTTVTVSGYSSDNTRGVFEIDNNTGSSFTLSGTGSLIVQRPTSGTSYADVYINPISSSVSSTSTVSVGLSTATTQSLRINIAPSIGNLSIQNGAGTNAQTVNMYSNSLVVGGTLTIPSPSVFITNSLNVSIAGDLNASGTYTGGTNTTTFNGTGVQTGALSSTSSFYNLTVNKTAGSTLTLSGTAPALSYLNILSGILDVGSLNLNVSRDITNNSSQVGNGSVVVYSTSSNSNTIYSSGGAFTNLTLGGTSTNKTIDVSGDLTINGALNFSVPTRYLMIASNQLTFGNNASITGASSANGFIRTNGVSSDLGVTKNWATGTNAFKYEIGTSTNYTPVSFSLNVTSGGTLNVVPVNSAHLTYNQGSNEQILNYYWTVNRGGTLVATKTANHTFNYPSSLITGGSGTLVAGYLDDSNPSGWITSGHGGTATTTQMDFISTPSTNFPSAGFAYDYSVGTINTLPNPIVPLYSRLGQASVANSSVGGNWTAASSWTTDTDGDLDHNNPSSVVPSGVPVVILSGARINMNGNGRRAYKITINGLLDNSTSKTSHNLGVIDGTGTFRTATNTFPAGNYTSFVSSPGGTIEYIAPMTMNNRTTYNNLSIYSGSSGTVSMTASNLIVNGSITIPSGTTLDNSTNNANMSVARSWTNSGTFTPGTGTVTLNGNSAQAIAGSTSFNNLTMAASANTTLSGTGTTTVNSVLTMTSGNIVSSASHLISIPLTGSVSGGSASSFISGPMTAVIAGSTTFNFPLGNVTANYYRPASLTNASGVDTWSAEYLAQNPTNGGYPNSSFNATSFLKVSSFEYWHISRSGSTSADVTLSFNTGSYYPPDIGQLSSLLIAHWDSNNSRWDLPSGGGSVSRTGTNTAGTVTVKNITSFSPLTFGSMDGASGLPIILLSFTGDAKKHGVELQWSTSSEINNSYFTILHSPTGAEYKSIGTVNGNGTTNTQHDYTLIDKNPVTGKNYYQLMQTDFDGHFTKSEAIKVDVLSVDPLILIYPNPVLRNQQQNLNVEINGLSANTPTEIQILNMQGTAIQQALVNTDGSGTLKATISPANLGSGLYILNVQGAHFKFVVE